MIPDYKRSFKYPFPLIDLGRWRAKRPYQFCEGLPVVCGYDTETADGKAYLITNSRGRYCYPTSFQSCIEFLTHSDESEFNYFWNLRYDAYAIFKWLDPNSLGELEREGLLKVGDYTFTFTPKFLIISKGKQRWVYTDLLLIYKMSLNDAGNMYLGRGKLDFDVIGMTPEDIVTGNGELLKYCIRDSQLTADLGIAFLKTAVEEGPLPTRVYSQASISEALAYSEGIGQSIANEMGKFPREMIQAAYYAYCGGWNQLFSRGYHEEVHLYDINSAFPSEMLTLPDLEGARSYIRKSPPSRDAIGWLYVEVAVGARDLPRLRILHQNHSLYPTGVMRIWATTTELKGLDYRILKGVWIVPEDTNHKMETLIKRLYARKQEYKGKDKFRYLYYKIALNSLYGKMQQIILDQRTKKLEAGRLFCPFYSSLITAGTRMKVYREAIKNYPNKIVGISTDAIFSTAPIKSIPLSDELGDWSIEGEGPAVFLASGVYHVKGTVNKSRQRCFGVAESKVDWFNILKEGKTYPMSKGHETQYVLKVPARHHVTLYKALRTKEYSLVDFNRIIEGMKNFDLNPDTTRMWEGEFTTAQEILLRKICSEPVSVGFLEGDNRIESGKPLVQEAPLFIGETSDRVYDEMRTRKVYAPPGCDVYAEYKEGVPIGVRRMISSSLYTAQSLDEWACECGVSVSGLIQLLASATLVKDRQEKADSYLDDYKEAIYKQSLQQDRLFQTVTDY